MNRHCRELPKIGSIGVSLMIRLFAERMAREKAGFQEEWRRRLPAFPSPKIRTRGARPLIDRLPLGGLGIDPRLRQNIGWIEILVFGVISASDIERRPLVDQTTASKASSFSPIRLTR